VDVTGWVLESSTDLGIGDVWDPVPGVVDNSVTVPMDDFPKNLVLGDFRCDFLWKSARLANLCR